jgi:NitT/TauT family transport system permease protein/sulfonate transport system permease protein
MTTQPDIMRGETPCSSKVSSHVKRPIQYLLLVLTHNVTLFVISITFFFLAWELLASAGLMRIPRITVVFQYLWTLYSKPLAGLTLIGHIAASLNRVLWGFLIAVIVGIPLGLAMAMNRYVDKIVGPIFNIFKPMPPIAWISISILWFGIGEVSKIFVILTGTLIPCVINAYNGVRLVDPQLYEVVRMLGGNKRDEIFQVQIPAALPSIFAGIQLALSMAWTCVVAAELIAARTGIGFIIIMGMNLTRPEMIFGGIVVIGLVGWLLATALNLLEKWLCPWKKEI